jgi:hypothetical protein
MNIKQALKEKNRLKGKFTVLQQRLRKHNVAVDNERPYDPNTLLEELMASTEEMISLKARIHRANAERCELIYRLSELKSLAKALQWIPASTVWTSEGKVPLQKTPVIDELRLDGIIEDIGKQIEAIQDELDGFNFKTIV